MRISALYFFILRCALFVLLACSDGGMGQTDHDAKKPTSVPEFSEESNKIYNALPKDLQLNYFKQKSKAAKELDTAKQEEKDATALKTFLMFKCATSNMKSDCEDFYPKFVGEECEDKKSRNANVREFVKSFMRDIKTDFNITIELGDMISNFSLTDTFYGVDERYRAKTKMTNYFYDICGYLSRYNKPRYRDYLTEKSYENAKALMCKIIELEFNEIDQKNEIIKFATFYARIRYWSNRFAHNCEGIFNAKSVEHAKKKGRDVTLCEVLDYMRMLKPLNFSKDDITRLNLLVEVVHNSQTRKYFHKSYQHVNLFEEKIQEVLPFVDLDHDQCHKWPHFDSSEVLT